MYSESLICLQPVVGAVLNSSFDTEESNLHTSVAVIVQVLALVNWSHLSGSQFRKRAQRLESLSTLVPPRDTSEQYLPASPEVWVPQRANMPLVPCIRTRHCNRTLRCTLGSTRPRYPKPRLVITTRRLLKLPSLCLTFLHPLDAYFLCSSVPGAIAQIAPTLLEKKRFPVISFVVPIRIGILTNSKSDHLGYEI